VSLASKNVGLGVIRDSLAMSERLPLYPRKPTFNARGGMSQSAIKRDVTGCMGSPGPF
jgi:hypothetical protein